MAFFPSHSVTAKHFLENFQEMVAREMIARQQGGQERGGGSLVSVNSIFLFEEAELIGCTYLPINLCFEFILLISKDIFSKFCSLSRKPERYHFI